MSDNNTVPVNIIYLLLLCGLGYWAYCAFTREMTPQELAIYNSPEAIIDRSFEDVEDSLVHEKEWVVTYKQRLRFSGEDIFEQLEEQLNSFGRRVTKNFESRFPDSLVLKVNIEQPDEFGKMKMVEFQVFSVSFSGADLKKISWNNSFKSNLLDLSKVIYLHPILKKDALYYCKTKTPHPRLFCNQI